MNTELKMAHDRLTEIQEEFDSLISEARQLLRETLGRDSLIVKRAEAYWIPTIEGSLVGRATMVSMQATLDELDELLEDDGFDPAAHASEDEIAGCDATEDNLEPEDSDEKDAPGVGK